MLAKTAQLFSEFCNPGDVSSYILLLYEFLAVRATSTLLGIADEAHGVRVGHSRIGSRELCGTSEQQLLRFTQRRLVFILFWIVGNLLFCFLSWRFGRGSGRQLAEELRRTRSKPTLAPDGPNLSPGSTTLTVTRLPSH